MPTFRPKFITFDCYGTLINFRMVANAVWHTEEAVERILAVRS